MLVNETLSNEQVVFIGRFPNFHLKICEILATMKSALLLVFTFLVFTSVHAEVPMHQLVTGLANMFSIDMTEVEKCMNKMGTKPNDFKLLDDAMTEDSAEINKDSLRRASCTAVCCAQKQGTMTGAKIEIPTIHKLIQGSRMPPKLQRALHMNIDQCHDIVKEITDECELGYRFVKCVIMKMMESEQLK
ncbi:uncharacterized protein LOC114873698 [Osmia bicornis bicornis]|uniref:uncharacterized protein LOC114873698 n=1 Tax=Osmia bicornis bicornis TaxID=1437191 RepID=UPI001EAECACA|nr:uncharacterized protein LOC114873698 [Osmia bicornis bicornis]